MLCSAKLWKKRLCIGLLLIPTLGKSRWTCARPHQWELSPLFTSFYRGFVYKQGTIRHRIFRKIETKRRCCADYTGSDSNVATQVWVTVIITCSLLCLLLQIIWYEYLCIFNIHNCLPITAVGVYFRVYNPIQSNAYSKTERSDEGGSKQDRK